MPSSPAEENYAALLRSVLSRFALMRSSGTSYRSLAGKPTTDLGYEETNLGPGGQNALPWDCEGARGSGAIEHPQSRAKTRETREGMKCYPILNPLPVFVPRTREPNSRIVTKVLSATRPSRNEEIGEIVGWGICNVILHAIR